MPRPRFLSIEEQGGLPLYLDLPEQRAKHNGYGWQMWIEWHRLKLSTGALAKLYGVDSGTIRNWNKLHKAVPLAKSED